ncbi:MAG: mechanosensitive ion channel domain-containing protein [Desulfobacterales bacterium]
MNNNLPFGSLLKKILGIVLPMAVLLISSHGLAHELPQSDQTSDAVREIPAPAPDLADIVPLATELSGRLAALENRIKGGLDISSVEKKYDGIEANLKGPAGQLQRLKDSKDYKYNKLVELREAIKRENKLFEEISKPLSDAIRQLGAWRKEWLGDQKHWNEWQSSLLKEGELDPLRSTFEKAKDTIDTALNLVNLQLEAMLRAQKKAGHIQERISALGVELNALIEDERRSTLLDESAPMFSSHFFSQFKSSASWSAVIKGPDEISWPDSRFFARQGWIVLLQGVLSLFVLITVYRTRRLLSESKRWRFLGARPFSAGFFLAYMATVLIYEYEGAPAIWKLANMIVGGISFARLLGGLIETSWKRQFVYGLIIVLITTRLMDVLSFPLSFFRLYTVLASIISLLFCLRLARESTRLEESGLYAWSLRLGALFFAVIMIAELWGKKALASHLFVSLIHSMATVLVFMLFMYMIRGGLEWLFRTSPFRRAAVLHSDTDAIIRRVSLFIDVAIWGLVLLPAILMIWGVYDTLEGATKGLLAVGLNLGSQRITVGLLIGVGGIVYGSFFISWIIQKLLMDEVLAGRRVEKGVRLSIARLVHYALILVGFFLALSLLGFDVTKLTIMLSALGVGIGFGLQGVVNNFVSGLILLFERPVRVGDTVEIGGKWAEIKRIGLRSTTVQTFDEADVIVPNADLVTNPVTNWTLTNRRVRLLVPVGVAYGSDVPLVMETLVACAKDHEMLTAFPPPQVLFLNFGESSLDFELRVWVKDADNRLNVQSELHQEIARRFREAKIEIAFPQQDLHLRSVDESVTLRPPKITG